MVAVGCMGELVPGLGQRKVCNDQNTLDGNMDFIPLQQKRSAGLSEMRLRPGTCRMGCVDKCVAFKSSHYVCGRCLSPSMGVHRVIPNRGQDGSVKRADQS